MFLKDLCSLLYWYNSIAIQRIKNVMLHVVWTIWYSTKQTHIDDPLHPKLEMCNNDRVVITYLNYNPYLIYI